MVGAGAGAPDGFQGALAEPSSIVAKDALPALRARQELQCWLHDFTLGLQPRQLARVAHQGFVNLDVCSSHVMSIHHFLTIWCMFRMVRHFSGSSGSGCSLDNLRLVAMAPHSSPRSARPVVSSPGAGAWEARFGVRECCIFGARGES